MSRDQFNCTLCNRTIPTQEALGGHYGTQGHKQRARAASAAPASIPPGHAHCDVCGAATPYERAQQEAQASKCGVSLEPADALEFGVVEHDMHKPKAIDYSTSKQFVVKATEVECEIIEARFRKATGVKPRFTAQAYARNSLHLRVGDSRPLQVHFFPRNIFGAFHDTLIVKFRRLDTLEDFEIERDIRGEVGSSTDKAAFGPKEPFVLKAKRRKTPRARTFVPGPKTKFAANVPWVGKLPLYPPPAWLRELLEENSVGKQIAVFRKNVPPLSYKTYAPYWEKLVWAEQVAQELQLREYDMHGAALGKVSGNTYILAVPGIVDKHPNVMRGDKIRVHASTDPENKWFEGTADDVRGIEVFLKFPAKFQPPPSARFEVHFTMTAIPTRRTIRALRQPLPRESLLFPPSTQQPNRVSRKTSMTHPRFFAPEIEDNPYQRDAVLAMYYSTSGRAPFILYGPPGTGKTTTLIEACCQLLEYKPNARLLLTAPSNAAADILCERLAARAPSLGPKKMLRLNAPSRFRSGVPTSVEPFTFVHARTFACPQVDDLRKFRVIVSTCYSASILSGVGLEGGHFSHVFVDEAGQATEPEAMLPLALAGENASVVLAGDPQQLGPIINSPVGNAFSRNVSLLERLMQLPNYADRRDHPLRRTTYVKLLCNYRSHPAILRYPNAAFYGSELEACAAPAIANRLQSWDGWPHTGYPVLFHNVKGRDDREGTNVSYFNVNEITVVKAYVRGLLETRSRLRLEDKDIGIIAPYAAQVKKLRKAINRPEMTIGSVEQFQGSERSLIINSTVRSNEEHLANSKSFALGFLSNPKRLNVALTRAQAGLVVVGDADTLALDDEWRQFLLYVHDMGGWAGDEWDAEQYRDGAQDPEARAQSEMDDIISGVAAL
ncbi:uncharacterized protein JCM10292_005696 [Rhodotorula paludigena]|uniref:uncharacterized protein n=1 Tax=Rhodotorula paludigena TaxID=86838 RepID=UPI003180E044